MNGWMGGGGWGDGPRSKVPTEVLSGESLWECGGSKRLLSHKKGRPGHFIPGLGATGLLSRTKETPHPYSSIVNAAGQSGAINMLRFNHLEP